MDSQNLYKNNKSIKGISNLLDALVIKDLINRDQHKNIKFESINSGKSVEDIILEKSILSPSSLVKVIAEMRGLGFINLRDISIPVDALNLISKEVSLQNSVVVFEKFEDRIKLAMLDPLDLQKISYLQALIGKKIEPYYATKEDISYVIDTKYGAQIGNEVDEALEEFSGNIVDLNKNIEDGDSIDTAPIIKIVNMVLDYGIKNGASDIHIEGRDEKISVRFRIGGVLTEKLTIPKKLHSAIVTRIKILSNLKIDEHRIPQDGRFPVKNNNNTVDVRVSIMPGIYGEKIVLRLLEKTNGIMDISKTGVNDISYTRLINSLKRTQGIILATGPTGSGKTQTLASCIQHINKPEVNIVTLEDPVEIRINGVNQTQINSGIGLTFASGLRSILRQDPDVILVGEIRDSETASLAVQSALVGRLVLSTLHTNSAAGAFIRLLDMGIEPFLLTSTINLVLAQRLVRVLDTKKITTYTAPDDVVSELHKVLDSLGQIKYRTVLGEEKIFDKNVKQLVLYRPVDGYDESSFKGRIGIFECLSMSESIAKAVIHKESISHIHSIAVSEGMITMVQDGFIKVLKGQTTFEEVLRVQNLS